jgi:hypothetical protein
MSHEEAVYEMLWDCRYCGQKKLLGITHRFCAGCGAPQDPQSRYFPPDNEKVAVQNHPYVGADVVCPACRQPMSRAAKCCTNCGGPIDKGAEVAMKADVPRPAFGGSAAANDRSHVVDPPPGFGSHGAVGPHGPPPAGVAPSAGVAQPQKSNGWIFGVIGGVVLLVVTVILVVVFWKREGVFEVSGHTWERSIAIERYDALKKSVWCDEAPSGARVLGRRKEQKGTTKEKDGETCGMRKKDLGNGSYKEVEECTPKYKDVPVMADKCDVEVTEWRTARTLTEKGASFSDRPRWPVSRVAGGVCIGCEREGARTERYTVRFVDKKRGAEATCDVPETRWATFPTGSKWKGQVRVMTAGLDCDNLGRL